MVSNVQTDTGARAGDKAAPISDDPHIPTYEQFRALYPHTFGKIGRLYKMSWKNNPHCICRNVDDVPQKFDSDNTCQAMLHGHLPPNPAHSHVPGKITQVSGERDPARENFNQGSPDYRKGFNAGQQDILQVVDGLVHSKIATARETFTDEGYTRALVDSARAARHLRSKWFATGFTAGVGVCLIISLLVSHLS